MANRLNGRQYRSETTRDDLQIAKEHGLVIVHGASDDLVELGGAIRDELGVYNGGSFFVTPRGILGNFDQLCDNKDEAGLEVYFREKAQSQEVFAVWCPEEPKAAWAYETKIPHATFDVMEDGELYCRGIVFALADVRK